MGQNAVTLCQAAVRSRAYHSGMDIAFFERLLSMHSLSNPWMGQRLGSDITIAWSMSMAFGDGANGIPGRLAEEAILSR